MSDIEKSLAIDAAEARIKLETALAATNNAWGYTTKGIEAKRAAMTMLSTKTGMYARIPLTCKAEDCPYSASCRLLPYDLAPIGEFCPVETAQIEMRYINYDKDFELEKGSFTDQCLVAEIIHCEIMMERCKALLAKEGVMVVEYTVGITEKGDSWTRQEVSVAWQAYEKASKRRNEALQLMMATRRDKKDDGDQKQKSLSELFAEISMEEAHDLQNKER